MADRRRGGGLGDLDLLADMRGNVYPWVVVMPHVMRSRERIRIIECVVTAPLVALRASKVAHMGLETTVDEQVVGGLPAHVPCKPASQPVSQPTRMRGRYTLK
jgi:hypothetical protein